MVKVSVIIPTYGEPIYLEKAIKSVQAQSMNDWDLHIIDDNDPDSKARMKTEMIVERFLSDERIKYVKHPYNMNGAVARNTGIRNSDGEYIAFLDADDEYMANRLEICCNALDLLDSKFAGVYTGCEMRRGGRTFKVVKEVKTGNYLVECLACKFMFCTGSNLFVRRSVVEELQGFDELFLRHQDYEFLVRLFEKYDLKAITEPLVIKNNENVNVPNVYKMHEIKKQYLAKFSSLIQELPEEKKEYIYHSNYVALAENAMLTRDYKTADYYYSEASKSYRITTREFIRKIGLRARNLIK